MCTRYDTASKTIRPGQKLSKGERFMARMIDMTGSFSKSADDKHKCEDVLYKWFHQKDGKS